jgi:hypothetical protein
LLDEAEEKKDRLDALAPGVRGKIEEELRSKLTPEYRAAWDQYREALAKYREEKKQRPSGTNEKPLLPPSVEKDVRDQAEAKANEIVQRAELRQKEAKEAADLAKEIDYDEKLALYTARERSTVNFDFWRTRAWAEQTAECLAAREAVLAGDRAYAKGDMIRARPEYEKGLRGWRKVLDDPEFNSLIEDPVLGGDLCDVVRRYRRCLAQDDLELKDPIIPQAVIDKWGSRQGSPLPPLVLDKKTESPPATQENAGNKGGPAAPSGAKRP